MFPFSREVRIFVSACEELQSLPMHGGALTSDEKEVVEYFAKNLLDKLEVLTSQTSAQVQKRVEIFDM
jgi:hypothetical protein